MPFIHPVVLNEHTTETRGQIPLSFEALAHRALSKLNFMNRNKDVISTGDERCLSNEGQYWALAECHKHKGALWEAAW